MTGKQENNLCYYCGGNLKSGLATIPFVVGSSVVIIKRVPADICIQCNEPILSSEVAEVVDAILKRAQSANYEISVLNFEHFPLEVV